MSHPSCWPMRTLGCAPCWQLWKTKWLCEDEEEEEEEGHCFKGQMRGQTSDYKVL